MDTAEYHAQMENAKIELEQQIPLAEKHAKAGLALINVLNKTFYDLIDYRDWGNVDLLIYLLETGRADSIKEALQLADRERQVNRIVEAVEQASKEISRTITISVARLQNDMRRCFAILSDQMMAQSQIIANEMGALRQQTAALSAQVSTQSAYISNLTSATNMNNALQAKSNESSAKLAADVEQLRINSDYAAMRMR